MNADDPIPALKPSATVASPPEMPSHRDRPPVNAIRFIAHWEELTEPVNRIPPMPQSPSHFIPTDETLMSTVYFETSEATVTSPLLNRLLQMADGYRENGSLKQASEMYFALAEQHEKSSEGQQARERLVAIAATYEALGQPRQARSVYERLLGEAG